MMLTVCLFLVLTVMGINLLNLANANVSNTTLEYDKEQKLLYVSSIYEVINEMIEGGTFSKSDGSLPQTVQTVENQAFKDGQNQDIQVRIDFKTDVAPIKAEIKITCENADGTKDEYKIISTYSNTGEVGKYKRESCKGLSDDEP